MYEDHKEFQLPAKKDARIWRYVSFIEFVSMLNLSGLHFTRMDKFEDKFEGALAKPNVEALKAAFKVAAEKNPADAENWKGRLEGQMKWNEEQRRRVAVNCWHVNEHQSEAMWRLYANSDDGIAIASTVDRLIKSIENSRDSLVFVGLVEYIDYETEKIPVSNAFHPALHKRISFKHEMELRAVAVRAAETEKGNLYWQPNDFDESGTDVKVQLDVLIEKVYLNPTSPGWIASVIHSVADLYGLKKPIEKSNLNSPPSWEF